MPLCVQARFRLCRMPHYFFCPKGIAQQSPEHSLLPCSAGQPLMFRPCHMAMPLCVQARFRLCRMPHYFFCPKGIAQQSPEHSLLPCSAGQPLMFRPCHMAMPLCVQARFRLCRMAGLSDKKRKPSVGRLQRIIFIKIKGGIIFTRL